MANKQKKKKKNKEIKICCLEEKNFKYTTQNA